MATEATEAVLTCSPSCGPWFHCQSGRCQPGPSGVLSFDNKSVLDCYCVTYNKLQDSVEIGKCIYNSMKNNIRDNIIYSKLPSNVSDLNKMFCDRFNRQGTLCGQCKDDHFPLAYSFNLTCVKCSHSKTNWISIYQWHSYHLQHFTLSSCSSKYRLFHNHKGCMGYITRARGPQARGRE